MGGRSEREGRVEMYHNRRWGSVCDEQWDDNEAKVACRQLGLLEHGRSKLKIFIFIYCLFFLALVKLLVQP